MSFASMDLSGEVTLGDALNKIRALKVSLQEQEHSYEARIDDLKDELGRVRDEKLQEMKRQRQAAKEREQALQADAEDRANALATLARREVADEVDTLREQLKDAENKAEAAAALLEDLQSNMDQRCDVEERDTGFKDAEVRLFKEKLMQQAEEAHALRLCIERERELHEAERIAWSRSQDQAAEALTAYRQRAAKSELNARWVSAVQQSLQAKDTTVRSTTAAVELLLHLLEELREVYGRIPADAIIHKTLRSSPSVAKATSAGVDVASLLSSGLPSFSKHRASANAFSSSKSRSPDPQTPSPLPQNPAFPIYTEEKREFSEHSGLLHGSPQAHEGVADAQGFALSASPVHAQLVLEPREAA
ncbi:hypothetical protein DIPPA_01627 [Diplonema papillatum]|nr:hypothetical protein DIPPA_01627 [Diplonema papillatum]